MFVYRVKLRAGVHEVLKIKATPPSGPFFLPPEQRNDEKLEARQSWQNMSLLFGKHEFGLVGVPDWHANPFKQGVRANDSLHWSKISDFDPSVGDIKTVWESSRFDWLIAQAQRAALGDGGSLAQLNVWLEDWVTKNPPYSGANWKCGQEASIRVMSLALTALLLGQPKQAQPGLLALIKLHMARIEPTIDYAIGQSNNHGTSEAAALFIGGSWLEAAGDPSGLKLSAIGRKWLENRAKLLIENDGTFSQYSVIYHRLMLDTYSLCEVWRRQFGLPAFSPQLISKIRTATKWLQQMTDVETGYAPNMGANDGARILALVDCDYRDCRPSLQLAATLFCNMRAIGSIGPWDQALYWHGLDSKLPTLTVPVSESLDYGGTHVLRSGRASCYMRYPRFRFRPSQADCLHVDLWHRGKNLLKDAGTYSYNSSADDNRYFKGTAAHNTIQIDGRDQMPSIGRFLFGSWLKAQNVELVSLQGDCVSAAAGYRDLVGGQHFRRIELSPNKLICFDKVDGNGLEAVLRWRLTDGDWFIDGNKVSNGDFSISLSSEGQPVMMTLVQGLESSYYLERSKLTVIEIKFKMPVVITSVIEF